LRIQIVHVIGLSKSRRSCPTEACWNAMQQ
jgi:hypothetical protein